MAGRERSPSSGNVMTRGGPGREPVGEVSFRAIPARRSRGGCGSGAERGDARRRRPWWQQMLAASAAAAVPLARAGSAARRSRRAAGGDRLRPPSTMCRSRTRTSPGKAKRLDSLARRHAGRRHGEIPRAGRAEGDRAAERVVGSAKDELDQTGFRGMNRLKLAAQDGDKGAQRVLDRRSRTPATTGRRSCRPRGT
jgi:hypothetical protein